MKGEGNLQENEEGDTKMTAVNRPTGQVRGEISSEHKKLIDYLMYVKILRVIELGESSGI